MLLDLGTFWVKRLTEAGLKQLKMEFTFSSCSSTGTLNSILRKTVALNVMGVFFFFSRAQLKTQDPIVWKGQ